MSYDITYCCEDLCPNYDCERNLANAPKDGRPISMAELYGSEYCAEQNAAKDLVIDYLGYTLLQAGGTGDHHIMIAKGDQMLMHIAYSGDMLNEENAKSMILDYIKFSKKEK